MKKAIIFAAIAAISFGATAQLKVVTNGQTQVGTASILDTMNPTNPNSLASGTSAIKPPIGSDISLAKADTLAPLCIMGLGIGGSWPRISFGNIDAVSIGEGNHATDKQKGNGVLTLKASNGIDFYNGDSSYIGTFDGTGTSSIPIQDFINVKLNSILSVYIQTPEYLPETILIPIGDQIENVNERYVLNHLTLGSGLYATANDIYGPISLNLGKNCDLNLFVYNSVTSDYGISVKAASTLTIESEKNVELQNDKISNGGTLNVFANSLILKKGFEVAKGSTFTFHNR